MTNQQGAPEALRLADEFDWWLARGITIEPRLYDAATELRRQHAKCEALLAERERNLNSICVNNEIINKKNAELESLRTGYAAARLEIESLRARGVASAGEYPLPGRTTDELMESQRESAIAAYRAAHGHDPDFGFAPDRSWIEGAAYVDADRAMRVAQPATTQQTGDCGNTPYDEGPFTLTQQPGAAGLVGALEDAQRAINSMKVEAETAAQGDEQMMLEACETISNEGLQADMAIRAALASHGQAQAAPQPSPAPQGNTQIAPADVLLRTAIAETLYQQVRIEHDNRIGPWSAFDVREQQRIVDSIQGLCSVFAPASQGNELDTVRLDWLDKNIFHREMSDWDAKYGHGSGYNMWVLFSPKGAQGSARNIIDAARAAQEGKSHEN